MDSFEWNKIAGAVLFALLVAIGLSILTEIIFETEAPESPAYVIAGAEGGEAGGGAVEAVPLPELLASADAGAGETASRRCASCHTFDEGGKNGVGPNLYGVVMRTIASHEGYQYSDAMHAFAAEAGEWTYEHLNTYLADPKGVVPSTKMSFAGLKDDTERANLIAYLRTLAASPVPLPEPEAAAMEEGAADETAEEPAGDAEMSEPAEEAAEPEEAAPADEQQGAAEQPAEQNTAEAMTAEEPTAEETAMAEEEPAAEEDQAMAEEPAAMAEETAAEEPAVEEEQVAAAETPAAAPQGDAAKGKTFTRRCQACHTLDAGGGNRVGPHLFGVFGRVVASVEDFNYSEAMKTFSEGGTKVWDAETLDGYLADPRGVVSGTKMIFPPVASEDDRANIIAYLATLTE